MEGNTAGTITDLSWIRSVDICGLWEVIRIREGDRESDYPWIKDRFKFNFLPEMIFLCLKDGKSSHGSWDFIERKAGEQKQYFIVLDGTVRLKILDVSIDEMIFTCRGKEYLLVRRL